MSNATNQANTPHGWMLGGTYAGASPLACPKCQQATALSNGNPIATATHVRIHMNCSDATCGARWERLYRIAGYDHATTTRPLGDLLAEEIARTEAVTDGGR